MKVKCIDDSNLLKKNITMYKVYTVIEELKNQYKICDDNGNETVFEKTIFEQITPE